VAERFESKRDQLAEGGSGLAFCTGPLLHPVQSTATNRIKIPYFT
jgi:hypothetical protein